MGFVSPNGKWIAYVSNESGKNEVYVTAFPKRSGKWQVSNGGARRVLWSRNAKELFFVSGNALMGVDILSGQTFDFSKPRRICEVPAAATVHDISPDGSRFLVTLRETQQLGFPQLQVVTNWLEVVKGKLAVKPN
jgi:Tol biopolymer transport system component